MSLFCFAVAYPTFCGLFYTQLPAYEDGTECSKLRHIKFILRRITQRRHTTKYAL